MFHNLLQVVSGSTPQEASCRFVEEVRVIEKTPVRHVRIQRLMLGCWIAIAAKCALVVWLVGKYDMSFDPLWVNAPTVGCGLICTLLYFGHE